MYIYEIVLEIRLLFINEYIIEVLVRGDERAMKVYMGCERDRDRDGG